MKVKKGDMLKLWYVTESLKNQKVNSKFSYFLAINRTRIEAEIKALHMVQEASESFKLYDNKRVTLAEQLADKDEKSQTPIVQNGQYVITKNRLQFNIEMEQLKEKFATAIEERENQLATFKDLLDEETEFTGYPISIDNFPESIEPNVMEIFLKTNLIKE